MSAWLVFLMTFVCSPLPGSDFRSWPGRLCVYTLTVWDDRLGSRKRSGLGSRAGRCPEDSSSILLALCLPRPEQVKFPETKSRRSWVTTAAWTRNRQDKLSPGCSGGGLGQESRIRPVVETCVSGRIHIRIYEITALCLAVIISWLEMYRYAFHRSSLKMEIEVCMPSGPSLCLLKCC